MGPAGELRYPSSPPEKLKQQGSAPELGEFQCYDKVRWANRSGNVVQYVMLVVHKRAHFIINFIL